MKKLFIEGILVAGFIGLLTCFVSAIVIGMYPREFESFEKKSRGYVDSKLCLLLNTQCYYKMTTDRELNEQFWEEIEGKRDLNARKL